MVVTRVRIGYKECCDSYSCRPRTTKVFWCLPGLAEDKKDGFSGRWVGLVHSNCCDGFRDRLMTTRV